MNRSHSANLFFLSFFLEVIFPYAAVDLVYPWDEFCFLEQHEELDPPWEEGLLEFNYLLCTRHLANTEHRGTDTSLLCNAHS